MSRDVDVRRLAERVLRLEAEAIMGLVGKLDERFVRAVDLLRQCAGRVIVTGMGKSGLIGRKIAATLASTGTPAFYVHPGEAAHGDLGMITDADVVLALSYSGESDEILLLLPVLRRQGNKLIAMTGRPGSSMAREADVHLDAVVGSGNDPSEAFDPAGLTHPPDLVVRTDSVRGGTFETADGRSGSYDPADPPGPVFDTYGAGDSFAAGLTFALGSGLGVEEALALAARCGAWCAAGKGPYGNQLSAVDIAEDQG